MGEHGEVAEVVEGDGIVEGVLDEMAVRAPFVSKREDLFKLFELLKLGQEFDRHGCMTIANMLRTIRSMVHRWLVDPILAEVVAASAAAVCLVDGAVFSFAEESDDFVMNVGILIDQITGPESRQLPSAALLPLFYTTSSSADTFLQMMVQRMMMMMLMMLRLMLDVLAVVVV